MHVPTFCSTRLVTLGTNLSFEIVGIRNPHHRLRRRIPTTRRPLLVLLRRRQDDHQTLLDLAHQLQGQVQVRDFVAVLVQQQRGGAPRLAPQEEGEGLQGNRREIAHLEPLVVLTAAEEGHLMTVGVRVRVSSHQSEGA